MNGDIDYVHIDLHLVGTNEVKRNWGWYVAVGACLIVIGLAGIMFAYAFTTYSMIVIGWLLVGGGLLEAVHGLWRRRWSGFFLDVLAGILYLLVGLMVITNPGVTAVTLTLLIALFLMISGVFRLLVAMAIKFHTRFWMLLHGAASLLLGIAVWSRWPLSGLWAIGLFIGVDLILNGWTLVVLGMTARALPDEMI